MSLPSVLPTPADTFRAFAILPVMREPSSALTRRQWMRDGLLLSGTGVLGACSEMKTRRADAPTYPLYANPASAGAPRAEALDWFARAGRGLAVRYGVFSRTGKGEFAQFHDKIPPAEYTKLKHGFDASGFDAERLADLALVCGARYVNFNARGPDGFCLFRTNTTDFTSLNSLARRDLVEETAAACRARGLGLFLSYSYAMDWRHPYFFPRESAGLGWEYARPAYATKPPEYRLEREEDFFLYLKFVHRQLEEILHRYESLAGLSLYPAMGYYSRSDLFTLPQTYSLIREIQPSLLIAFGPGANGEEDFTTHRGSPGPEPSGGALAAEAWVMNHDKPKERRLPVRPGESLEQIKEAIGRAGGEDRNVLLEIELEPGGGVSTQDAAILERLGDV